MDLIGEAVIIEFVSLTIFGSKGKVGRWVLGRYFKGTLTLIFFI